MDWNLAIKIAGSVAAVSTIPVFFWTNLRKDVRRTAIIDLATKRIAFWNQLLTTINLATTENSPDRKAEQDKACKAIAKIQEDANVQLQALARSGKIGRATGWKSFRFERNKLKTWIDLILWWYYVTLSGAMFCVTMLILARVEYDIFKHNLNGKPLLVDLLIMLVFIALTRFFLYGAESRKYPSVTPPIIDSICRSFLEGSQGLTGQGTPGNMGNTAAPATAFLQLTDCLNPDGVRIPLSPPAL